MLSLPAGLTFNSIEASSGNTPELKKPKCTVTFRGHYIFHLVGFTQLQKYKNNIK